MTGAQLGALIPAIVAACTAVGSLIGVAVHSSNASARIAKIEQVITDLGGVGLKDFGPGASSSVRRGVQDNPQA